MGFEGSGAGAGDSRSWNRPHLPNNGTIGWFNSNPPNNQGRVGLPGNTATDVRLGQFVVSQSTLICLELSIGYIDGIALLCPNAGLIALFGIAGLTGRRRR